MALSIALRRVSGSLSMPMRAATARVFSEGQNPLKMPSEDQLTDDDFIDVFNDDFITGIEDYTDGIIYPNMANSVEWVLSSPPPLHQFYEPPIMVDCQDDTECEWINPTA